MGRFHQRYDLYLTPTLAFPPVRIGELQPKPYERLAMKVVNALGLGSSSKRRGLSIKWLRRVYPRRLSLSWRT